MVLEGLQNVMHLYLEIGTFKIFAIQYRYFSLMIQLLNNIFNDTPCVPGT